MPSNLSTYPRGQHPNSRLAIEKARQKGQWQAGQSGNPAGTPGKLQQAISPLLRRYLTMTPQEFYESPSPETTMAELVAWDMVQAAATSVDPVSRIRMQQLIIERLEGPSHKIVPPAETETDSFTRLVAKITDTYVRRVEGDREAEN